METEFKKSTHLFASRLILNHYYLLLGLWAIISRFIKKLNVPSIHNEP
jgi:hypothetical protein